MKRKLLIFLTGILGILLSGYMNLSHAQSNYFNNSYTLNANYHGGAISNNVCVSNGNVLFGNIYDVNWNRIKNFVIKIDHNGVLLWKKFYGDSLSSFYVGLSGSVLLKNDSNILCLGTKVVNNPNEYHMAYLYELNLQGDTLWSRNYSPEISPPWDTSFTLGQLIACDDGGYLFAGTMAINGAVHMIAICKIDSNYNMEFFRGDYGYTGLNIHTLGYTVIQSVDQGFLIGGYVFQTGISYYGDAVIVKTDSLGNLQWIKKYGGIYKDDIAFLAPAGNSNFISATLIATQMLSFTTYYKRINFTKFNIQGDSVWSKQVGPLISTSGILCIKNCQDGGFLACGQGSQPGTMDIDGWITKIDSSGNLQWYRELELLNGPDSYNYLLDIVECADGSLIASGNVIPRDPDTGYQRPWVIKLDSIGCPYPGCDTLTSVPVLIDAGLADFKPYPNPASDYFYLNLPEFQGDEPRSLELNDLQGRVSKVYSAVCRGQVEKYSVADVPQGCYILRISLSGNQCFSRKIIVLH